ncbi:globin domain-containing protein [Armatimonas sp.]|uniref:globin domain-containing protein n=1 Tax=Armatimonas sp. TaxID=1872638 RepID=UPI0037526139
MTETQKQLLRELLTTALERSKDDEATLARLFYNRLFTVAPEARSLFHNKLRVQEAKLTRMLETIRDSLERLDNLVPTLWQSGRNHKLYGAESAHYEIVGEALLWALEQKLGMESVTDEVRVAWQELYSLVSLIMQEAAQSG